MSTVSVTSTGRPPPSPYRSTRTLEDVQMSLSLNSLSSPTSPECMTSLLLKPLPRLPQGCSSIYSLEIVRDTGMREQEKIRPQTAGENIREKRTEATDTIPSKPSLEASQTEVIPGTAHSLMSRAFLNEEQYGVGIYMARANHYFREKKWEIFPELAPQQNLKSFSPEHQRKRKWNTTRRIRRRPAWKDRFDYHAEGAVQGFKTIHTYMTKPRLRKNLHEASQTFHRPALFPQPYCPPRFDLLPESRPSSTSTIDSFEIQRTLADVNEQLKYVTLQDRMDSSEDSLPLPRDDWLRPMTSVMNDHNELPGSSYRPTRCIPHTQPVPRTIGRGSYRGLQFLRRFKAESQGQCEIKERSEEHSTKPVASPLSLIATRSGSSQSSLTSSRTFLAAWDRAKQLLTEQRAARRRMELKKQIRLIGPIDHYPDGTVNQWM